MGKVNWGRVILGGVVMAIIVSAGEFVGSLVFADQWNAAMADLGIAEPSGAVMGALTVGSLVWGIMAVWLYAAIRPRYGPGPKTAICAGSAVWFFSALWPMFAEHMLGMWPLGLVLMGAVWGFVEFNIGMLAGAALYKEEEAAPAPAAPPPTAPPEPEAPEAPAE